jgi:transposase
MLGSIGTAGDCLSSHAPQVQDRNGGGALLHISCGLLPFIEKVWADGSYHHDRLSQATSITVAIFSKIAGQSGFVVLPRRWVVERFFAWINRNRRLAKDVKATLKSAAAFFCAAAAMFMIHRSARSA